VVNGYGFFVGSLCKDKVNVVNVTFVVGHSFKKYVETFINVDNAFLRVASSHGEAHKQAE
jgi:hypothetical protein